MSRNQRTGSKEQSAASGEQTQPHLAKHHATVGVVPDPYGLLVDFHGADVGVWPQQDVLQRTLREGGRARFTKSSGDLIRRDNHPK
jgi:hypothetical protein